jgi:hypothetical protein
MTTQVEKQAIRSMNNVLAKDDWFKHHKVQVTRSHNIAQNYGRFIFVDTYRNALLDADGSLGALLGRIHETVVA